MSMKDGGILTDGRGVSEAFRQQRPRGALV